MKRIAFLTLAVSCLAACGVGVVSGTGSDDQPLGSDPRSAVQPQTPAPPTNPAGGNVCIEGSCAAPDAGTPPPPPPPPPPSSTCPAGQTAVYRYVADSQMNSTGARLIEGPGGDPMTMTCETSTCGSGEVEVIEVAGQLDPARLTMNMGETDLCVPPPPTCGAGLYANYIPPTQQYDGSGGMTAGQWTCTGACDVLIQYGGMFGMRLVCAPPPPASCPANEEPQFDVTSETWGCQPACNGGTYDPAQFSGQDVCVPC